MEYVLCTLLGPEGPGRSTLRGWVGLGLLDPGLITRLTACGWLCGGGGYRPYFENYTVDASIYTLVSKMVRPLGLGVDGACCVMCINDITEGLCFLVVSIGLFAILFVKFLRANGECLGIWSRRRTYKSAISLGELIIEL